MKYTKAIRKILKSNQVEEKGICDTMKKFHDNLTAAIKKRDEGKKKKDKSDGKKRVRDYLIFIYSRLIAKNEKRDLTLKEIFDTNKHLSKYELSEKQHKALEEFCNSSEKCAREQIIKKYNKKYLDILDNDAKSNEKSSVIYLNITQELFDNYKTKEQFYDAILSFIKIAYKKCIFKLPINC